MSWWPLPWRLPELPRLMAVQGGQGTPMELQGHVGGHLAGGMGWGCPGLSPSLAAETTLGDGGVEGPTDQVLPASGPLALVPRTSHGL